MFLQWQMQGPMQTVPGMEHGRMSRINFVRVF